MMCHIIFDKTSQTQREYDITYPNLLLKRNQTMEDDFDPTIAPAIPETDFSFKDLDDETIAILVDDKIATGG